MKSWLVEPEFEPDLIRPWPNQDQSSLMAALVEPAINLWFCQSFLSCHVYKYGHLLHTENVKALSLWGQYCQTSWSQWELTLVTLFMIKTNNSTDKIISLICSETHFNIWQLLDVLRYTWDVFNVVCKGWDKTTWMKRNCRPRSRYY